MSTATLSGWPRFSACGYRCRQRRRALTVAHTCSSRQGGHPRPAAASAPGPAIHGWLHGYAYIIDAQWESMLFQTPQTMQVIFVLGYCSLRDLVHETLAAKCLGTSTVAREYQPRYSQIQYRFAPEHTHLGSCVLRAYPVLQNVVLSSIALLQQVYSSAFIFF